MTNFGATQRLYTRAKTHTHKKIEKKLNWINPFTFHCWFDSFVLKRERESECVCAMHHVDRPFQRSLVSVSRAKRHYQKKTCTQKSYSLNRTKNKTNEDWNWSRKLPQKLVGMFWWHSSKTTRWKRKENELSENCKGRSKKINWEWIIDCRVKRKRERERERERMRKRDTVM